MSTVTPITAASRKRAGTSAEHMVRLQGRMALTELALRKPVHMPPPVPRRPHDDGPRAA